MGLQRIRRRRDRIQDRELIHAIRTNTEKASEYKYEFGGKGSKNAAGQTMIDCSGFMSLVLKGEGYPIPNSELAAAARTSQTTTKRLPNPTSARGRGDVGLLWLSQPGDGHEGRKEGQSHLV